VSFDLISEQFTFGGTLTVPKFDGCRMLSNSLKHWFWCVFGNGFMILSMVHCTKEADLIDAAFWGRGE